MQKGLAYGDQVYIQFIINDHSIKQTNFLMCSNAFFENSLIAVDSSNNVNGAFINCVFTLLPCLIDTKDERELLKALKHELYSSQSESENEFDLGLSTLRRSISEKKKLLETNEGLLAAVNKKIIDESIGKSIRFGESVLLQHNISSTYLCATQNSHPIDKNLLNLTLVNEIRQDCCFRIMNILDNACDTVEYNTDLRIVSLKYDTQITVKYERPTSMNNTRNRNTSIANSNANTNTKANPINANGQRNFKRKLTIQTLQSEQQELVFPLDLNIKSSPIDTFNGFKYNIGMQLDNKNSIAIRFIEFCTKFDQDRYNKNKNIKNGTFIRLQSTKGYLTSNCTSKNKILTLNTYGKDEYQFNYIDTIFQIVNHEPNVVNQYEIDLPLGNEIYSTSKKVQNSDEAAQYYLKHHITGAYVCNSFFQLDDQNYPEEENLPLIELISNGQEDDIQPINRSTTIAIKIKYGKNDKGRYLIEKENEQDEEISKKEIKNEFYIGTDDTNDAIANTLKISKKELESDSNNGIQFKLLPIPDNKMLEILEIESYVKFLKKYLKMILDSINNKEIDPENLNKETKQMIDITKKFLEYFTSNNDAINSLFNQKFNDPSISNISTNTSKDLKQSVCREFKIIDIISMILVYMLGNQWFSSYIFKHDKKNNQIITNNSNDNDNAKDDDKSLISASKHFNTNNPILNTHKEKISIDNLNKLLLLMTELLSLIIKDNKLNQEYCGQFLKIYLKGFLNTTDISHLIDKKIKQFLMNFTIRILENVDIKYLNELLTFKSELLENLSGKDGCFNTINLKFLNFIFKSKASYIQDEIASKFINDYLDNDKIRNFLLPQFKEKEKYFENNNHDYIKNIKKISESKDDTNNNNNTRQQTQANENDEKSPKQDEPIYCVFRKIGKDEEINLNEYTKKSEKEFEQFEQPQENKHITDLLDILELLNSLANQRSLKFNQIIMKYYPIKLCLKILENDSLLPRLKYEISKLLTNVHFNYTELPFVKIPDAIQLIFNDYEVFHNNAEQIIQIAKKNLISNEENQILIEKNITYLYENEGKKSNTNLFIQNRTSKSEIKNPTDIKENFEKQSYKLHLMKNILAGSDILELEKIIIIQQNINELLEMMNEEMEEINSAMESQAFMDNAEILFSIIEDLDNHLIQLELMNIFGELRQKSINSNKNNSKNNVKENESKDSKSVLETLEEIISLRFPDKSSNDQKTKENISTLEYNTNNNNENDNSITLQEKINKSLLNLIEKKSPKLASLCIKVLQSKAKYESKILWELNKWAIIVDKEDCDKITIILKSLLDCHQISRRLRIIKEFNLKQIDNKEEMISKIILKSLENIIISIYDYVNHIGKAVEDEKDLKTLFIDRLKLSKDDIKTEKPFVAKSNSIKIEFQKILANLNAHKILIPLILEFAESTNFVESDPEFKLIYRFIIIILILFVKGNQNNQLLLANNKDLINIFTNKMLIESNTDIISLFYEICHANKKLLNLEFPYIHNMIKEYFSKQDDILEVEEEANINSDSNNNNINNEEKSLEAILKNKSFTINTKDNIDESQNTKSNENSHITWKNEEITSIPDIKIPLNISSNTISTTNTNNQENNEKKSLENKSVMQLFLKADVKKDEEEKDRESNVIDKKYNYKLINKIRNLSLIFSPLLPKESFDSDAIMIEKLYQLEKILNSNDKFDIQTIFSTKPTLTINQVKSQMISIFHMNKLNNNNNDIKSKKNNWIRYKLPITYTLVKELINSELEYAKTIDKNQILFMQSKYQSKDFIKYLRNSNIEYNFEIKGLILQFMKVLFYKKSKKANVFETSESFDDFISILFVDIIAYIIYQENAQDHNTDQMNSNSNKIIDYNVKFFDHDCFILHNEIIKKDISNYQQLFKSHNINTFTFSTFLEYQHDLYFIDNWKNYIFECITDIFLKILKYDSQLMLENKEKNVNDNKCECYFNVWLLLTKKLVELAKIEEDKKYINKLYTMIEKIIVIPEFVRFKVKLANIKNDLKDKDNNNVSKKEYDSLQNVINEAIKKSKEKSLRILAINVNESKDSIEHLIKFINQENKVINVKDILFVIRLLKKVIEIQNDKPENLNKPINEWNDLTSTDFQKISVTQNILKDFGIVKTVYHLLLNYFHHQKILEETIELSIALLYGGNKEMQDLFLEEFLNDTENALIQNFAKLIDHAFTNILASETSRNKNKNLYFKAQNCIRDYFNNKDNNEEKEDKGQKTTKFKEEVPEKFYDKLTEKEKENISKNPEPKLLMSILKFMQCLCENHHAIFQEFLTNQVFEGKVHPRSFDFTSYFRTTYQKYFKILNKYNIDIGIALIDLLIEILQGESKEIANILLKRSLVTDLCRTLTWYDNDLDLLPRGFKYDKYDEDFQILKTKCIVLLKTLLEHSDTNNNNNVCNMSEFYDIKGIVLYMTSCFQRYTYNSKKKELPNKRNIEIKDYFEEPYLLNGLTCYIILKYLWENEEFDSKMIEVLEKLNLTSQEKQLADYMILEFCKKYIGSIEIFKKKTNQLIRIYFPILVAYDYLTPEIMNMFEDNVDRSNTQTKVENFMEEMDKLINETFIEYKSRNRFLGLNMFSIFEWLRLLSNSVSVIANLINLLTLIYQPNEDSEENPDATGTVIQSDYASLAVLILGIINMFLSFGLFFTWITSAIEKLVNTYWVDYNQANIKILGTLPPMTEFYLIHNKEEDIQNHLTKEMSEIILKVVEPYSEGWEKARSKTKLLYYYLCAKFLLLSGEFMGPVLYTIAAIGSGFYPILCATLLFDIVMRSDIIYRLGVYICNNASQFMWTLFLLITTIYIFSLCGFYLLNDELVEDGVRLCSDEYSCFLVNLNYGLRSSGIGELLTKPIYDPNNRFVYLLRVLFDLSFFILVIILMLNLIFGMIIDTFGELRDEKNKNEDDKKNFCFLCGISRSEIERYFDFEDHTTNEHNKWHYLAYLIYIKEKNELAPTELTDIESYVWDRYTKKDHAWLPIGRSLTLELNFKKGEKQKKGEIDVFKDEVLGTLEKIAKDMKNLSDEIKDVKVKMDSRYLPKSNSLSQIRNPLTLSSSKKSFYDKSMVS